MTTRRPLRSEATVQRQAIKLFAQYGIELTRRNTRVMRVPGKGGRSRLMMFGKPGDPDSDGTLPGGRRIEVEFKREGWVPAKARGKDLVRWQKQLAHLRKTNSLGGVGLWLTTPETIHIIAPKLLEGWRIDLDENGRQLLTDEPPAP